MRNCGFWKYPMAVPYRYNDSLKYSRKSSDDDLSACFSLFETFVYFIGFLIVFTLLYYGVYLLLYPWVIFQYNSTAPHEYFGNSHLLVYPIVCEQKNSAECVRIVHLMGPLLSTVTILSIRMVWVNINK